jgi:hypothetical protein
MKMKTCKKKKEKKNDFFFINEPSEDKKKKKSIKIKNTVNSTTHKKPAKNSKLK